MKKLVKAMLLASVVAGTSFSAVIPTSAFAKSSKTRVLRVVKVRRQAYHATKGVLYSTDKLSKMVFKNIKHPHTTWYVTRRATVKKNGKRVIAYYVKSNKFHGWIVKQNLVRGKAPKAVKKVKATKKTTAVKKTVVRSQPVKPTVNKQPVAVQKPAAPTVTVPVTPTKNQAQSDIDALLAITHRASNQVQIHELPMFSTIHPAAAYDAGESGDDDLAAVVSDFSGDLGTAQFDYNLPDVKADTQTIQDAYNVFKGRFDNQTNQQLAAMNDNVNATKGSDDGAQAGSNLGDALATAIRTLQK